MILLGNSGCGKTQSLYDHYTKVTDKLDAHLGSSAITSPPVLSLFIQPSEYSLEVDDQKLAELIRSKIAALSSNQKLVVYMDGFDQFGQGKEKILQIIRISHSKVYQSKLKIVVTCRVSEVTEETVSEIIYNRSKRLNYEIRYFCLTTDRAVFKLFRETPALQPKLSSAGQSFSKSDQVS